MIGRKTKSQTWVEQEMNNLGPTSPPPATEPRIGIGELLELLNSAPAAKEFLTKVSVAHERARKQLEAAKLQIENEHKDHLAELTRENAEALAKDRGELAKDRVEFGKERAAAWAEIEAARKAIAADRETVDAMKADARRRLERISLAATETA
jgi:hypothetical protein